jgi:hypothetical protein
VEIVLPDPAANPFLPDLKALGKVVIGCRNRYRDDQLDIVGCGEKVRALIEEHVRATGVALGQVALMKHEIVAVPGQLHRVEQATTAQQQADVAGDQIVWVVDCPVSTT